MKYGICCLEKFSNSSLTVTVAQGSSFHPNLTHMFPTNFSVLVAIKGWYLSTIDNWFFLYLVCVFGRSSCAKLQIASSYRNWLKKTCDKLREWNEQTVVKHYSSVLHYEFLISLNMLIWAYNLIRNKITRRFIF